MLDLLITATGVIFLVVLAFFLGRGSHRQNYALRKSSAEQAKHIVSLVQLRKAAVQQLYVEKEECIRATEALCTKDIQLLGLQRKIKELTHEVDSTYGLWATDQPELIRHHNKRECFFRIGYPEDRL